jgi:hypothetical protein
MVFSHHCTAPWDQLILDIQAPSTNIRRVKPWVSNADGLTEWLGRLFIRREQATDAAEKVDG